MRLQPLALADHDALKLSIMTLPVLLQRCSRIAFEEVERRRHVSGLFGDSPTASTSCATRGVHAD